MNGRVFDRFSEIWNEEGDPLGVKFDQLKSSWWEGSMENPLLSPPDRPHIKHVIMAYGVDVPTEVGYVYQKTERKTENGSTSPSSTAKSHAGPAGGAGDAPPVAYDGSRRLFNVPCNLVQARQVGALEVIGGAVSGVVVVVGVAAPPPWIHRMPIGAPDLRRRNPFWSRWDCTSASIQRLK